MRRLVLTAITLGLLAALALSTTASAQETITLTIGPGRDEATGTGTATLTDLGDGTTEVVLDVADDNPNMPAHVHADACPGVGPVVFPLTNAMDGMSTTVIDAPLSEVLETGGSINLHLSPEETGVYVGCVDLPAAVAPAPAPVAPAPAGGPSALMVAGALAAAGAGLLGAGAYLRRPRG